VRRRASLRGLLRGRPGQCGEQFERSVGGGQQRVVCGNAWVCPACALKARKEDAERISSVIGAWQAQGGSVVMVTLTAGSHAGSDGLDALLGRLDGAWKRVVGSRRPWGAFERTHRVGGLVRVLEVERGRSGWHPHFHVLLLVEGRPAGDAVAALVGDFRSRWCAALAAEGGVVPAGSESVAVQGHLLRRPEIGIPDYLAKGHADLLGRLAADVQDGLAGAREEVKEFQRATQRPKRLVVTQAASRGGRVLSVFWRALRASRAHGPHPERVRQVVFLSVALMPVWLAAGDTGLPGP
jgi:hypothetical protein